MPGQVPTFKDEDGSWQADTCLPLVDAVAKQQLVLEALGSGLYSPIVMRLRSANAVLNVVTLAAWAGWAASRQPGTAPTGRVSRPVSIGEARSTERSPA